MINCNELSSTVDRTGRLGFRGIKLKAARKTKRHRNQRRKAKAVSLHTVAALLARTRLRRTRSNRLQTWMIGLAEEYLVLFVALKILIDATFSQERSAYGDISLNLGKMENIRPQERDAFFAVECKWVGTIHK